MSFFNVAVDGCSVGVSRWEGEAAEVDVADCLARVDARPAARALDAIGHVVGCASLEAEGVARDGGSKGKSILRKEDAACFHRKESVLLALLLSNICTPKKLCEMMKKKAR